VHVTAQTLPTGINRIDGDTSSTRSGDGTGSVNVNVAVVDTGIDSTHPDLNVVGGHGCAPGVGTLDGNGHGSHVSGTIAAKDDANGVVGVVQRPARRRRCEHVPPRHRRPVRELQQLRDGGRGSEPHDRGARRLHLFDVHAGDVRHALGNEHGLPAHDGHGRTLHRDYLTRAGAY
jgi:hypothetical protein